MMKLPDGYTAEFIPNRVPLTIPAGGSCVIPTPENDGGETVAIMLDKDGRELERIPGKWVLRKLSDSPEQPEPASHTFE
jgi:hypothetical protein